jgi:hypothetical protein
MDHPMSFAAHARLDTGLPRPAASTKMPTNLSFIHGPVVARAINLAE